MIFGFMKNDNLVAYVLEFRLGFAKERNHTFAP